VVAGYGDGTVLLWDLGGPAYPPMQVAGGGSSVLFSTDDRRVLIGSPSGRQARLFDAVTGRQLAAVPGPDSSSVNSAVFSADEKFVLTANGGPKNATHILDLQTGAVVRTFPLGDVGDKALYSPDGKLVATSQNLPLLRLWDAISAHPILTITLPGPAEDFVFSPDGKFIVMVNGVPTTTVSLWDVATGQEVQHIEGLPGNGHGVALSPDGKWVAAGGNDKIVQIWDIATGQEVQRFVGHTQAVLRIAFSPDRKWLATASSDKTARLWDVTTGQELRRFSGHTNAVQSVAFSHDGKLLVTGSADKTARIWRTDYHDTMRYLCGLLTRDLTQEERTHYGITDQRPTCPAP
jgi:WD40 repeat protein